MPVGRPRQDRPPRAPPLTDVVVVVLVLGAHVLHEGGGQLLRHLDRKGRHVLAEFLYDRFKCEDEVLVLDLGPDRSDAGKGQRRWYECQYPPPRTHTHHLHKLEDRTE